MVLMVLMVLKVPWVLKVHRGVALGVAGAGGEFLHSSCVAGSAQFHRRTP